MARKEFIKRNMTHAEEAARQEAEEAGVMPSAVMYSAPEGYATGEGVDEYREPTQGVHEVTGSTAHAEDGTEHSRIADPKEYYKAAEVGDPDHEVARLFTKVNESGTDDDDDDDEPVRAEVDDKAREAWEKVQEEVATEVEATPVENETTAADVF